MDLNVWVTQEQEDDSHRRATPLSSCCSPRAWSVSTCRPACTFAGSPELTNAHSKKMENHDAMLGLYFAWYNWCRHHTSVKTTPAVQAGLASTKWTLAELLTQAAKG